MNSCGVSVTPKPRRTFSVTWLNAPSTASDDGQCDRFSRKWGSTNHTVLNPSLSAALTCSMVFRYASCSASRCA